MYYLDNNATTKMAPEVFDAMALYFKEEYYNPSSVYLNAKKVSQAIEHSRLQIANLLNSENQQIIFTSCGSEANSLAISGILNKHNDINTFITSEIEHSSILAIAKYYESKDKKVCYIKVDNNGEFIEDSIFEKILSGKCLVSIQWVNSETGVIQNISRLGKKLKEINSQIILHVDAVQAVGKIPIDLEQIPEIDLLSISAHKFYGPKGVGALFIRDKKLIDPIIYGGKQEFGLRAGTENVPAIIGMGKAAELCNNLLEKTTEVEILRDYFESKLIEKFSFVKPYGKNVKRVYNTSFMSFGEIENQLIISKLDKKGIMGLW